MLRFPYRCYLKTSINWMKMKRKSESEIASCNYSCGTSISRQNKPASSLIRSKFANIMIKVDADVYHLDRLQLACKSDYFEKLFIEDFREKKVDFLELPIMDSDTFSKVVDVIYGQELKSVLNADNYIDLFMAMDYLQMRIDLKFYGKFVKKCIQNKSSLDSKIFKLCKYVAENKNYDDFMPFVYTCMSVHFAEIRDHENFLSLSLDQVIGILCGQRINYARITDVRQCSQTCVKWIFHDVENRLPHAMKLVNAVKRRLSFPYYINIENFKEKMRETGKEVTPDTFLIYFVEMVTYQGEIGTDNAVMLKTMKRDPDEIFTRSMKPNPIDQKERDKMARFLENGDFFDIVVRVEGKTFKLHRCKLLSESGYFANIFSTESSETSDQPNKDEEYLLDVEGIDQKSFGTSIRYIYHRELELHSDTIVSLFKTACLLKIDSLLGDCELWIMRKLHEISSEIVVEILNFIRNANLIARFENMYECLLCQRILPAGFEIDDISLFYAIPIEMLENLLITPVLHRIEYKMGTIYEPEKLEDMYSLSLPENLGLENPDQLLDICSKWVMEDVQNRYHFIPRIARAINCNLMTNFNFYKMETPDLSNCSEQSVRDELLRVLLSNPLITQSQSTPRKNTDEPVFVTSNETMICILNSELDEIASLWLFKDFKEEKYLDHTGFFHNSVSSTAMGDNLFIVACINVFGNGQYDEFHTRLFFQSYNISSKKFTSLAYLPEMNKGPRSVMRETKYVLLNCRNVIYCCFENGLILKYVMLLNRWTNLTKIEKCERKDSLRFTSDGKTLYKLYETEIRDEHSYSRRMNKFFETYDFDRNLWIPVPDMTINADELPDPAQDLMTMNNGDVAVLFSSTFWIFDQNSRNWRQLPLPKTWDTDYGFGRLTVTITQWEDRLLYLNDELYCYQLSDSNRSWRMEKKNMPFKQYDQYDILNSCYHERFECLNGVHRPATLINADVL